MNKVWYVLTAACALVLVADAAPRIPKWANLKPSRTVQKKEAPAYERGDIICLKRDAYVYKSAAMDEDRAVLTKAGTKIKVSQATENVVMFIRKKRKYYVYVSDCEPESLWDIKEAQRREKAAAEAKRLAHLAQVLEGKPAQEGKAVVRRLTCATYTPLMLSEYKGIVAADQAMALAWMEENMNIVDVLEPGEPVVVLWFHAGDDIAKISTRSGKIFYCIYSNLMAAEE